MTHTTRFFSLFLLSLACFWAALAGAQTPLSYPNLVLSKGGKANAVVVQADGKVIAGGDFNRASGAPRTGLARLNVDGTLDSSWTLDVDGSVEALHLDGTALYVGGSFTTIGGVARNSLAKVDTSTMTVVASWNPNVSGTVNALDLNGTDLIIAGSFWQVSGQPRSNLAKVDSSGSVVPGWTPNPDSYIDAMVVTTNSVFVAGPWMTTISGASRTRLAKIDAATAVAANWAPNPDSSVLSLSTSSGSNFIYAAGYFNNIDGQARSSVAKLNRADGPSGTLLVTGWNPAPDSYIESIDVSGSGDVFVAGPFLGNIGGAARKELAKVDDATGAALAWSPLTEPAYHHVGRELFYPYRTDRIRAHGGNLYFMSDFVQLEGTLATGLARVSSSTGALDTAFTPELLAPGDVFAMASQPDGKVLVGGSFHLVDYSTVRTNLLRLNADGSLDTTLNLDIDGAVRAIAVDGSDFYIGGTFFQVGGNNLSRLAKISQSGFVSTVLGNNANGGVRALALDGSGSLYVSGSFSFIGNPGYAVIGLAKLDKSSGAVDTAFNASMAYFNDIHAMAVDSGNLYVGGNFSGAGGLSRSRIAKLNAASGMGDSGFSADANDLVDSLLAANASLYVAGRFTTIGGATRQRLARLDLVTGAQLPGWIQNSSWNVTSLSVDGMDLYAGLAWNATLNASSGTVFRWGIAKLKADTGAADTTWSPAVQRANGSQPVDVVVHAKATQVLVGGMFNSVAGIARGGLAALPKNVVPLRYSLDDSARTLFFGFQTVGTVGASRTVTITNFGTQPADFAGFSYPSWVVPFGHNCGTVAPGSSCTASFAFSPSAPGLHSGTITPLGGVSGGAIPARGYGIAAAQPAIAFSTALAPLLANSVDFSFGNQGVGISRTENITIHNVGSAPLNITGFSGVSFPFSAGGSCVGTIAAGASCTLAVLYQANAVGHVDQTLTILSNASNNPRTVQLSAVGEDASLHGSLEPTFANAGRNFFRFSMTGPEQAWSVAAQADGKFLVLGETPGMSGGRDIAIMRFNGDGTPDTSWNTVGQIRLQVPNLYQPWYYRVRVQPDGKVLAAVNRFAAGVYETWVYRLMPDGQLDGGFGTAGKAVVANVTGQAKLMGDGRIVVGGNAASNALAFTRLHANGSVDSSFGGIGPVFIGLAEPISGYEQTDFDVASDGSILTAHTFTSAFGDWDIALHRLDSYGARDTTFGPDGRYNVRPTGQSENLTKVRILDGGKILLLMGGSQPSGRGYLLARLLPSGAFDTSFGSGGIVDTGFNPNTGEPIQVIVLPNGKMVAAGSFLEPGGFPAVDISIVRYNANGSLDASFGAGGIKELSLTSDYQVPYDLALMPDGSLVAAGPNLIYDADRDLYVENAFVVRIKGEPQSVAIGQNDFNADGKPDIVWSNTANGATYVWHMNGTVLLSDAFIAQIDPSWKVQGVADFNGDGKPDLVWRNTGNGNTYVWYMNGASFISDAFLFGLPPEWVIQGVADFNADDKPDFLMRNTNSGVGFAWFFNDNVAIGDQFLFGIDPVWKVEQVGDMNADGQPDLLFRNTNSGLAFAWYTQYSGGNLSLGGSSSPIFSIDPAWEIVQLDDWNGDANPDLLFRNTSSGVVFVWYMTGTTLGGSDFVIQIDPSWEIVPRR